MIWWKYFLLQLNRKWKFTFKSTFQAKIYVKNFVSNKEVRERYYSAQVFLYSLEKYLVYIYNFVILKSPELQNSCGQKIFWFSHYQNHIFGFVKCLKILTSTGIFLYVSISLHVQIITVLSQVFIEKKIIKMMNEWLFLVVSCTRPSL